MLGFVQPPRRYEKSRSELQKAARTDSYVVSEIPHRHRISLCMEIQSGFNQEEETLTKKSIYIKHNLFCNRLNVLENFIVLIENIKKNNKKQNYS